MSTPNPTNPPRGLKPTPGPVSAAKASAGAGGEAARGFEVGPAQPGERRWAIARLLDQPAEGPGVAEFEQQSSLDGSDLDLLWVAREKGTGRVVQSCLAIENPGRTAVVLVSPGNGGVRGSAGMVQGLRVSLIERASEELSRRGGVVLAQSLMEPAEGPLIEAFLGAGFTRLADLAYMRAPLARGRAMAEAGRSAWPSGVRVASVAELEAERGVDATERWMREALERSYEGTLDCPALCGMRTLEDVVASHRAVGVYDGRLWHLMLEGERATGCILLSGEAGPGTVELVYLGLAAGARGRGLGAALLRHGLASLADREEATVACAVDLRNRPALEVYRRAGFRRFASRVAVVRRIGAQREG